MFDGFYGVVPEAVMETGEFPAAFIIWGFVILSVMALTASLAFMFKNEFEGFIELWLRSPITVVGALVAIFGLVPSAIISVTYSDNKEATAEEERADIVSDVISDYHIGARDPEVGSETKLYLNKSDHVEGLSAFFERVITEDELFDVVETVEAYVYTQNDDGSFSRDSAGRAFDFQQVKEAFLDEDLNDGEELEISEDEIMTYAVDISTN